MSGIAGIYHRDGRPVEPELLQRMTELIAHRGPDGTGYWVDGPVGMSHQMCHTTPESLQERQPLVDAAGTCCLTFDGRVDNREELRRALEQKGMMLRTDTDAELVLQAYACWGEQCPKYIIGDFVFVIWDGHARQIFCARDILGAKPFYYYLDKQSFFWVSEQRQFIAIPAVAKRPNLGMIGEYLIDQVTSVEETLYADVMRLPPAHYLVITAERVRKARYWDIDPAKEIRYSTDQEYAEHFLEIFQEAVRCHLRSQVKVGVCLSGGLDSSSIVGMVQFLYYTGRVTDMGFETFSLVFPDLPCDERSYIQDVVDKWQLKYNYVQPLIPDYDYCIQQVDKYCDIPDVPNGIMSAPLEQVAQQKGFRVLLNGLGGDEWFTGSRYRYLDLLYQFKLISLFQQFFLELSINSKFAFLRSVLKSILPEALVKTIRNLKKQHHIYKLITEDFAKNIHLLERTDTVKNQVRFNSFAQADIYRQLVEGWRIHALEAEERRASWLQIEYRSPFNDRRFIEFAFALPEEQRWRFNKSKFILRNAMRELLPDSIYQRTSKAESSPVFMKTLTNQAFQNIFDSLPIITFSKWINGKQIRSLYEKTQRSYIQDDQRYIANVGILWNTLAIYFWLITFFPGYSQLKTRK